MTGLYVESDDGNLILDLKSIKNELGIEVSPQPVQSSIDSVRSVIAELKATRRVASRAGSERYNLPIGAIIHANSRDMPSFRPSHYIVHHHDDAPDKSRVVAVHGPGGKLHVTRHADAGKADDYIDKLYENFPHLPPHVRHNVRGRQFRLTGNQVHMQQEDGSFKPVATSSNNAAGKVVIKPNGASRGTAHDSMREALASLVPSDSPERKGETFRITARLREVMNSAENKHMRDPKSGETKTHDGQPIPPAWTQVEVSKDPKHPLQARGRDTMGNVQPLYSLEHKAAGKEAKHARGYLVAQNIPKLDKALTPSNILDKDVAAAVYLLRHTGARVDSSDGDKSEVANTVKGVVAYGITSMEARHVKISGDKVTLTFVGKSGKNNTYTIKDPIIAEALRRRIDGKGPKERVFNTNSTETANFIKKHLGVVTDRPNHDLRTHFATSMAAEMVAKTSDRKMPTTEAELKRQINAIGDAVAKAINDTRTVALNSYINPEVFTVLRNHVTGGM